MKSGKEGSGMGQVDIIRGLDDQGDQEIRPMITLFGVFEA
jgi:hypothetical protein